ncbi:MAG: DUF5684 domain-containing protein [Niabella sp.]
MYENSSPFLLMTFLVPFLIIAAICIVSLWKIYQKAGYQGWESIVPIYNIYILTKIVGKPWWWLLLMCIPYIGAIWGIWTYNLLSKSFGKTEGFTVGIIFLPFIFLPMLAFGDAKYLGPYGDKTAFDAYGDKNKFDFERTPEQ